MKLSELGQRLLLHPTSITSTVDSLEKLGYVERTPHPTDRRATMATITDAGRQAIIATSSVMRDNEYWLDALTEDEALELFRLLRKVRDAAGDIVPIRHEEQPAPLLSDWPSTWPAPRRCGRAGRPGSSCSYGD